jgi:GAF domain-containing protein
VTLFAASPPVRRDTAPRGDAQSGISVAIAQLIRAMHTDDARPARRLALVTAAALRLPGVAHADIMAVERGGLAHSVAATDSHPVVLEKLAQRYLSGPCLESARDHVTRRVDDAEREARWPDFTREVSTRTPIRSLLCLPLFSYQRISAALNLYADTPMAFGAEGEETGSMFAMHAAATLEVARREKRVRRALTNRDVIGQAKGVLMERFKVDAVTAFALLAQLSKDRGESVSTTASVLVRRTWAA